MTLPANSKPFGERLPDAQDRAVANRLRQLIAAAEAGDAHLYATDSSSLKPVAVHLTPMMSALLTEVMRSISAGDAVTLVPVSKDMTTQQAADILNVSRPHLIKLLEEGALPFHAVGRHRRIRAQDVFDYKARRNQSRADALSKLAELDADHL